MKTKSQAARPQTMFCERAVRDLRHLLRHGAYANEKADITSRVVFQSFKPGALYIILTTGGGEPTATRLACAMGVSYRYSCTNIV